MSFNSNFKNVRDILEYSAKKYENNLAFKLKTKENKKVKYNIEKRLP